MSLSPDLPAPRTRFLATVICLACLVPDSIVFGQQDRAGSEAVRESGAEADAEADASVDDPEFDRELQLKSFDKVWETVRKTHWQPDRVGESWDAEREKFRPRVEAAESIDEVRKVLNEMLETLDQSHFGIIPAHAYESLEEDENEGGGKGTLGLEIRYLNEQLVVTRVTPGFPADQAGIRPGWVVTKLKNRTADKAIEKSREIAENSVMRMETILGLGNDARTSGDPGSEITLELLDNEDQPQSKTMNFVKSPGKPEKLGNLPEFNVHWQSQQLDDDIGYVSFNAFIGGPRLAREFAAAIDEYQNSRGLVIDLRGNRGGLVILVSGMCGWLVSDRDPIGTMNMAGGTELNLVLNPRRLESRGTGENGPPAERQRFDRPVAVLIDECSISAAEIMAGGLKDLGAAEVFGSTTAGLALPSVVTKLPNGDGFQYAMASYHSASGQSLEGQGVAPTQPVELTRELLARDGDPVLAAAKKWILETGAHE